MAGEGGLAFEPVDAGRFADELGRGQFRAARDGQQSRGDLAGPFGDALGQGVDLGGKPDDVAQFGAGQFGDQPGHGVQPCQQCLLMDGSFQRAGRRSAFGVEFVDVPPQPVDRRRALRDKHITTIGQQLQLP